MQAPNGERRHKMIYLLTYSREPAPAKFSRYNLE